MKNFHGRVLVFLSFLICGNGTKLCKASYRFLIDSAEFSVKLVLGTSFLHTAPLFDEKNYFYDKKCFIYDIGLTLIRVFRL